MKERFGYDQISYANKAVGGKTSDWGLQEIQWVIDTVPDLVVLAFGMNDASQILPAAKYKQNTEGMIQALRAANPDVGIVLVAEFSPNPELTFSNYACGLNTAMHFMICISPMKTWRLWMSVRFQGRLAHAKSFRI